MGATVRVPPEMEPLFAAAEQIVSRFFRERCDDPSRGTIEIFGERYVLVRAASLSVEFFRLVRGLYGVDREGEAEDFARNILFDLAHAVGRADAENFASKMELQDPIARLSAGPVHFAHAGWAFVDISPESRPSANDDFYLVYDHPYSFEADAWLRAGERHQAPACIMNAGYSSGWCEASFGVSLVATEILCRARGDEQCRFIMARPHKLEKYVRKYVHDRPEVSARGWTVPDFFARKRIEEELRRSHDELEVRVEERTRELRREIAERESVEKQLRQAHKLEAIGRLAGGIAHDFNNLMAIVLARSSMLLRKLGNDPMRAELESIRDAAERSATLVRQLLAFSRSEVVQRRRLDLGTTVAEMSEGLVPLIGEDVELAVNAPSGHFIEADRGQIEQVVMNLVVNARDAMAEGGPLTVEVERIVLGTHTIVTTGPLPAGEYAVLRVGDRGVGMDEETQGKIFDPFFTTKRDGRGTGLGLSTVYGIVRDSGGGIAVSSAPGQGTTFALYFPLAATARADLQAIADASDLPMGRESLLLVEDQEELRIAIESVLSACGYRVHAADGPTAALAMLERVEPVDLLISDVVMPRMGGPELAHQLRQRTPSLKVLLISGYAPDDKLRREVLSELTQLLPKPFRAEQLARKVREMLDA
jgi:signal transduction histidine kinase/predicted hydrocarbon binding protein